MWVVVALINFLGRAVCHQLAERSLLVGEQLPVCARCTGLFIGVFVCHCWLAFFPDKGKRLPLLSVSIFLSLLILPLAWDGVTSYVGLRQSTNLLRLCSGLAMGTMLPLFYLPLTEADPRPVSGRSFHWGDLALLVLVIVIVGSGLYSAVPSSWWIWASLIAIGHFSLYFSVFRLLLVRAGIGWYWALPAYGLFVLGLNLLRNLAGV